MSPRIRADHETLTLRLPAELYDRLAAAARAHGGTVEAVAISAIERFVHEGKTDVGRTPPASPGTPPAADLVAEGQRPHPQDPVPT